MKLQPSVFLLAYLLAAPALSADQTINFTGDWLGTGQLTGTGGGMSGKCTKIRIKIEHQVHASPQTLLVKLYDATCGLLAPDWGPYQFEIRSEKVFADNEEVGTLQGNLFKTMLPGGGAQYAFNMRLVTADRPSEEVLRSYYGARNLVGVIVIEGDLKRSSSE